MESSFTKNMYDDESTLYREFNQITLDQIESTTSYQEETVYRSVSLLSQSHSDDILPGFGSYNNIHGVPMVTIPRDTIKKSFLCPAMVSSSSSLARILKAPELPDLLLLSHFEVSVSLDVIFSQIEKFLKDTNGLSYDFNNKLCQVCSLSLRNL